MSVQFSGHYCLSLSLAHTQYYTLRTRSFHALRATKSTYWSKFKTKKKSLIRITI